VEFFEENSAKSLDTSASPEEQGAAGAALLGYLSDLVDRKGREPGDDLLSRLITDHMATGALNHETATINALIMLSAGHETTASMIALGTVALLEHPDAWNRLRDNDDPALVANVVEDPGGSEVLASDLAEFITDVRAIDTGGRTFAGAGRGGDLRSHDEWIDRCFKQNEQLFDVVPLRRIWAVLRELPRRAADVMTHGDLIPGNVLVGEGRLVGSSMSAAWGLLIPRWTSCVPGISSTSRDVKRSGAHCTAMTSSGNAERLGHSSRPWVRSGITCRAIPR
jgi:phosphotransferase family enzyme